MSLNLSKAAAQEIKNSLSKRGGGLGIRLAVQPSDCEGMTYRLEFLDSPDDYDLVFENHGARVYIDPKSLLYAEGTEIDYLTIDDMSGFVINNPNAKKRCGCNENSCA